MIGQRTVYLFEALLAFRDRVAAPPKDLPAEIRRHRRGSRAGVIVRGRREKERRRFKPVLPSVIMGNVRSLANKTDELAALVKDQQEY